MCLTKLEATFSCLQHHYMLGHICWACDSVTMQYLSKHEAINSKLFCGTPLAPIVQSHFDLLDCIMTFAHTPNSAILNINGQKITAAMVNG